MYHYQIQQEVRTPAQLFEAFNCAGYEFRPFNEENYHRAVGNWMVTSEVVVVHELCHLSQRGHSARFWRAVKSLLPDFERRRAWLRDNSHRLMV